METVKIWTNSIKCILCQIHDGPSENSTELGKFCNGTLPPALTSTSNSMLIHFKTDSSVTKTGFNASYTSGTEAKFYSLHNNIKDILRNIAIASVHVRYFSTSDICIWVIWETHDNSISDNNNDDD